MSRTRDDRWMQEWGRREHHTECCGKCSLCHSRNALTHFHPFFSSVLASFPWQSLHIRIVAYNQPYIKCIRSYNSLMSICSTEFPNAINYKIILRDEAAAFWPCVCVSFFMVVCSSSISVSSNSYTVFVVHNVVPCGILVSLARIFFDSIAHRINEEKNGMVSVYSFTLNDNFHFELFLYFIDIIFCCFGLVSLLPSQFSSSSWSSSCSFDICSTSSFSRKCTFRLTHLSFFSTSLDDGNLSFFSQLMILLYWKKNARTHTNTCRKSES